MSPCIFRSDTDILFCRSFRFLISPTINMIQIYISLCINVHTLLRVSTFRDKPRFSLVPYKFSPIKPNFIINKLSPATATVTSSYGTWLSGRQRLGSSCGGLGTWLVQERQAECVGSGKVNWVHNSRSSGNFPFALVDPASCPCWSPPGPRRDYFSFRAPRRGL